MILAFDTYYSAEKAKTVCLCFQNWEDAEPLNIYEETIPATNEYIPGEFYKRELPCILSLLNSIDLNQISTIVVDGYVVLDDEGKPGLGAYLNMALDGAFAIIGVAKNNFATLISRKKEVFRGGSVKPLYITAVGIGLDTAAELIQGMHGAYRMPTLLKQMDTLTKAS